MRYQFESSQDLACPQGYVCGYGTTPDISLEAPQGQFNRLCTNGYYCKPGTQASQELTTRCPAGYFCPVGSADPFAGFSADDAMIRGLNASIVNPYSDQFVCKLDF